ncbi:MAG: aspartate carbamoyltransferase regulatory subunit [Nanoarchaeota archaeon]|nr:aspartate carbamoyltransferase regulatory subunit [Nanoarchaeota archaeon]
MKELHVQAIENGTVIDHIESKQVYRIVKILNCMDWEDMVLIGTNLGSLKTKRKGVIKFSNRFLSDAEINKISLLAGNGTINIIKNYGVVDKKIISIPDKVEGMVKCFNPNCISNFEKVLTKFFVLDKKDIKLKCYYCEKITESQNISFVD